MPVRYILSSVWVRLSIFSQLSIIKYVGLCAFSLPISLVMIERIYNLCLIIIIKSEVWTTTHCLGLGHETMVCAVCLSIFFWANLHVGDQYLQLIYMSVMNPVMSNIEYTPRKYMYIFDTLCFVVVGTSHILQGYFTDTGAIVWLLQCLWIHPKDYCPSVCEATLKTIDIWCIYISPESTQTCSAHETKESKTKQCP